MSLLGKIRCAGCNWFETFHCVLSSARSSPATFLHRVLKDSFDAGSDVGSELSLRLLLVHIKVWEVVGTWTDKIQERRSIQLH